MTIRFLLLDPRYDLGFLPGFASEDDPRPLREQLDANYQHGGGWRPFEGFTLVDDTTLQYPGDPPMRPIAAAKFRDEIVLVYPYSWVLVLAPDSSWEVCRMD